MLEILSELNRLPASSLTAATLVPVAFLTGILLKASNAFALT